MDDKRQLGLAVAAFAGGVAWGALRHRRGGRSSMLALLQGAEWFVACGGATALVALLREAFGERGPADGEDADGERITHFRRVVTERTDAAG